VGFLTSKGGGFSGAGNLEGNESLYEEEEEEGIVAEYNNQDDEPYYDDVKPTKKSPSKKKDGMTMKMRMMNL
jgi:hypothetical protein